MAAVPYMGLHCMCAQRACLLQRDDKAPPGLVTLPDGSIDEDHYVKTKRVHPSFVKELKIIIEGELIYSVP